MKTAGRCFCGAIEYTAEIDAERLAICHCRDCQIFSGSAFRTAAAVDPAKFRITKGTPRAFDKTADSGNVRRMLFCGDCGTHICSQPSDPSAEGAFVSLRWSTSEDYAKLAPRAEIFCESKRAWMPALADTVRFERGARAARSSEADGGTRPGRSPQ